MDRAWCGSSGDPPGQDPSGYGPAASRALLRGCVYFLVCAGLTKGKAKRRLPSERSGAKESLALLSPGVLTV